jgi:hypothetical protein
MKVECIFLRGLGKITPVNLPSPLGVQMAPGNDRSEVVFVQIVYFPYGQGLIRPPFSEKVYKITIKIHKLLFDKEKMIS